jgi:hypothetical protein
MGEDYLCRITSDDAYKLFVECRDYKGPINTMTEPRKDDRFIYVDEPTRIKKFGFWVRNTLKNKMFGDVHDLMYVYSDVNSEDTLFFVRSDGLMYRKRGEYDSEMHRDYLMYVDGKLLKKMWDEGRIIEGKELIIRSKKALDLEMKNIHKKQIESLEALQDLTGKDASNAFQFLKKLK